VVYTKYLSREKERERYREIKRVRVRKRERKREREKERKRKRERVVFAKSIIMHQYLLFLGLVTIYNNLECVIKSTRENILKELVLSWMSGLCRVQNFATIRLFFVVAVIYLLKICDKLQ
jgi:hypothetical protein